MRSVTCVSVEIQVFILEKSHIKFYQKIWMFKSIVDSLLTHFFYQRDKYTSTVQVHVLHSIFKKSRNKIFLGTYKVQGKRCNNAP